jgi:phage gp29-like protein
LLLGTTQGDPAKMVEALSEAVNGAVAAVGHGDTVQAVESKGTGTQFSTFDDQICKRIQKIILGQTLTTDIQHRGSFAAAQVHNEVRIDRRNADIRMVTTSVQRIITTLWQLNNFPGAAPRFVIEDGQGLEVERAARDVAMVSAGMMDVTEEYLKRVYDFEDGDFKIPVKPDPTKLLPAPGANPFQPKGTRATLFATAVQRYTPKQQVIEDALSLVLGELPASPIDDAAIRAAILASRDSRELVANLSTLLADLDPRTFQTVLERALYAADLTGYEHANRPDLPSTGETSP